MPGQKAQFTLPDWLDRASIEYAVKLLLLYFTGGVPPANGGAGNVPVTGITEVDTLGAPTTAATTNVPAGALSITIVPLTGFIGTINGTAWLDAATADALGGTYERVAQPGNILGAYTITRSAGKYSVLVSRPPA